MDVLSSNSGTAKPLVSICMMTYNHEPFIARAIESVLMQDCVFSFELIIGEDASTDRTREICESFQKKNPDRIVLINHKTNVGMHRNFLDILAACRGKYLAMLDSDDYWTDAGKLRKQVEFLEANPDFSICFHRAKVEYESGISPFYPDINCDTPETTTINDIAKTNYIHSSTVLFRNHILAAIPDWFRVAYPIDWPMHILTAQHGKIHFSKEEMAVYRVHGKSVHSTRSELWRSEKSLSLYQYLGEYFRISRPGLSKNFSETFAISKTYLYGLLNIGNRSRFSRFKLVMGTAFSFRSFAYLLRAFVVLLRPSYYADKNRE